MSGGDERWSERLVKTSVDEDIFIGVIDEVSGPERDRLERLRAVCSGPIETKERLREVRSAVATLKKERRLTDEEAEVFDLVRDEFEEIAEDLRFAGSRRGRFVLAANDWVQTLYSTLRLDPRFADAMVGMHAEREALLAAGSVATAADLDELRRILAEQGAPWPVEFQVRVETA